MSHSLQKRSLQIKKIAADLGFMSCGISNAGFLEEEAPRLENWLQKGFHGKMSYMENHFDKRLDPTKLVPGAKSIVSLLFNYCPEDNYDSENIKLSKYAYGVDYHYVIKDKLKTFTDEISAQIGHVDGRVFVDSAPVLDRVWAAKSGLGWIGKHSLLLSKKQGSFFFIAELIIDMELATDDRVTDHCGSCTACIDACPTDAIVANKVVDATKCISYLTIELKDQIPTQFKDKMEGWVFGCDICQDVCPWNRFSSPHKTRAFDAHPDFGELAKNDWTELTEEVFRDVFRKSAVKRAGFLKLKQTIDFVSKGD